MSSSRRRAVLRRPVPLFRADGETRAAPRRGAAGAGPPRRVRPRRADQHPARRRDLVHLKCNAVPLRDDEAPTPARSRWSRTSPPRPRPRCARRRCSKRLVETINHEFRTPLAALLGHVELIHDHRDRRDDLDPELASWLDAIERSGWRLRDLVQEVAELVNRDEAEQPVDRSRVGGSGSPADPAGAGSPSRRAHSAGRGTDRTVRLSVGISATAPRPRPARPSRPAADRRQQRAAERPAPTASSTSRSNCPPTAPGRRARAG